MAGRKKVGCGGGSLLIREQALVGAVLWEGAAGIIGLEHPADAVDALLDAGTQHGDVCAHRRIAAVQQIISRFAMVMPSQTFLQHKVQHGDACPHQRIAAAKPFLQKNLGWVWQYHSRPICSMATQGAAPGRLCTLAHSCRQADILKQEFGHAVPNRSPLVSGAQDWGV